MEMHLVHYKKEYGSQEVALSYDDGLAVVSFLFQVYFLVCSYLP
jgi:hypothetical protein